MKNRVVVLLVSGLLVFSMIGCGSDAKQAQSSDVVVETETQLAENEIEEIEVESTEIENTEVIDYSDIDYADTLVEIEGGDGTEVAVEETIESAFDFTVTDCEPTTKYANTNANIRSIPDKTGELINTVSTNTEILVTGYTDNGWSRIENSGLVCYIKSSLLSDSKVKVSQSSTSSGSSQTSDSSGGTSSSDSSSGGSSSGNSQSNQDVKDLAESLFGESTNGGTGGYDGGSTGSDMGGYNLGGGH